MPTPTYDLISSTVLSSSAAAITITSIPSTYRDLVVVCQPIHATSTTNLRLNFNNDGGLNSYLFQIAIGNSSGSVAESGSGTEINLTPYSQITTSRDSLQIIHILDYSATDKHKIVLVRSNRAQGATEMQAHRWANANALNRFDFFPANGNLNTGTTVYIYGIAG